MCAGSVLLDNLSFPGPLHFSQDPIKTGPLTLSTLYKVTWHNTGLAGFMVNRLYCLVFFISRGHFNIFLQVIIITLIPSLSVFIGLLMTLYGVLSRCNQPKTENTCIYYLKQNHRKCHTELDSSLPKSELEYSEDGK